MPLKQLQNEVFPCPDFVFHSHFTAFREVKNEYAYRYRNASHIQE